MSTSPESGDTTQDLRNRFEQHLAEADKVEAADQRIRTRGNWLIGFGATISGLVLLIAIVWHVGFGDAMPAVYAVPLYALGIGAAFLGCMEVLFRPYRAAQNRVSEELARVQLGLQLLVKEMPVELQQRWYAGYSRGYQDGDQAHRVTGTDGPAGRYQSGDVVRLRRRNDPPTTS